MKLKVYQSEFDSYIEMQSIGKLKYIGESFYNGDGLTNQKIYDVVDIDEPGLLRVVDDSGEDYLYSIGNPAPLDGSSEGGRWELIEDYTGELSKYIQ